MLRHRVIGFCGNSWRPAKVRALVEVVGRDLRERHAVNIDILDLVDAGPGLAAFSRRALSDQALRVIEAIEHADGLVIGSPVFQGSYPGLFKHVFDLIRRDALRNRPVLLTSVGGGLRHSLVVEHALRPLFGFFEACTVSTAIYSSAAELAAGEPSPITLARIANAADQFASCLKGSRADAA